MANNLLFHFSTPLQRIQSFGHTAIRDSLQECFSNLSMAGKYKYNYEQFRAQIYNTHAQPLLSFTHKYCSMFRFDAVETTDYSSCCKGGCQLTIFLF